MQNIVNFEKSTISNFSSENNGNTQSRFMRVKIIDCLLNQDSKMNKLIRKRRDKRRKQIFTEKTSICHFYPCMRKFTSRENLDIHISNIHLKLKPFQCKFCQSKFSHLSGI